MKTCHCGAPRRPGGNHCAAHHAEANRLYRERKQEYVITVEERLREILSGFADGIEDEFGQMNPPLVERAYDEIETLLNDMERKRLGVSTL